MPWLLEPTHPPPLPNPWACGRSGIAGLTRNTWSAQTRKEKQTSAARVSLGPSHGIQVLKTFPPWVRHIAQMSQQVCKITQVVFPNGPRVGLPSSFQHKAGSGRELQQPTFQSHPPWAIYKGEKKKKSLCIPSHPQIPMLSISRAYLPLS